MSEHSVEDWPPSWALTAPETHVLSYRGGGAGVEPFRLAVSELVARRVLSLEPVERRRGKRWVLTDGPASRHAVEPPLKVVLDLVRDTRREAVQVLRPGSTLAMAVEGVLVKDLGRAMRKAFKPIDKYRVHHVGPALVARGLLEVRHGPPWRSEADFDWTAGGREADAQLGRWLELGRDHLSGWVETDRARAAAFVREAGSAVLLMRESFPALAGLSRRHAVGVGDAVGGEGGDFDEGPEANSLNSEGLALDLDLGGLVDLSGGLGFGVGFGDGGGGGGGDGGGGGGGGD